MKGTKSPFLFNMIEEKEITNLVSRIIEGTDAFIVEIKVSINRILISLDKPKGITIDECAAVSRKLYEKLEASGMHENHELVVGSPGLDEPLKVHKQYLKRLGKRFRILTVDGIIHNGILNAADPNGIDLLESFTIREDKMKVKKEEVRRYSYQDIKEAKFEFSLSKEKV